MDKALAQRIVDRFAALSAADQKQLWRKIADQGIASAQLPLPRFPGAGDRAPLSHAQQRLWFLWNLNQYDTSAHIAARLRFQGQLRSEAVQAAFTAIVDRHESLRTTFAQDEAGIGEQRVHPHLPPEFRVERVNGEQAAIALADAFAATPFDLLHGPLLRVLVCAYAQDKTLLTVAMHHIVSDGRSMEVLLAEFVEEYRAAAAHAPSTMVPPTWRYLDYAVWQRQWLEAGERERQLAYWQDYLGSEQPVLDLPADHPRLPQGGYRAGTWSQALPMALADASRRYAQTQGATPFMVLHAALQVLLHRYTGQGDIRVGVPNANRNREETTGLIGFFVNTQVLRGQIAGHMRLEDVVAQVRAGVLGAQAWQDLPFDVLVDVLQPERSLGQTPLFQVMHNHQRQDHAVLEKLPGLSIDSEVPGVPMAQFDLTLETAETAAGGVTVSLVYAQELFDAATMARWGTHYIAVLQALVTQPQQTVAAIEMMDSAQRLALLAWGAGAAQPTPWTGPVHALIEAQAARTPEAMALACDGYGITYAELDARAGHLARRLAALGVTLETRVGVLLERGLDLAIGLLAVLKAGGAYVPLDPEYPAERLQYMIEDSGMGLLMTRTALQGRLRPSPALAVLDLDAVGAADAAAAPHPWVAPSVQPDNLAYVIYTSGSTGRPKAVGIGHAAMAGHTAACISSDYCSLAPSDQVLQFSTFSFDAFVEQLFPALCVGASVVMRGKALWDSATFLERIADEQVTVADLPTAYVHLLIEDLARGDVRTLANLRQIHAGGEALSIEAVKTWARLQVPGVRLFNTYGPTEATVTAATFDCGGLAGTAATSVPIGRPLPGRSIYVLDDALSLVPPGAIGELYIGGGLLARGYLGRAALTAERFVPDPYAENGQRLYRTGDVVRWNAGGQLEYLGRGDHQIKIRGFRIELGEVEAQLLAQPDVRQAVVVAVPGAHGERLAAYVTPRNGVNGLAVSLDGQSLRGALAAVLPDYMVPSSVTVLAALPLNPNGKLDRAALPAPQFESQDFEAPQGAAEEALGQVWQQVLGVERVGRHDNFFELGGDSILSLQIVARLRGRGWKILPAQLFERQTVALLAMVAVAHAVNAVDEAGSATARDRAVGAPAMDGVAPSDVEDAYPLAPMQSGMLFHSMVAPAGDAYVNQMRVDVEGLDVARFEAAWVAAVVRHGILRTGFVQQGGQWLQWVARKVVLPFEELDWRGRADLDQAMDGLARAHLAQGFDLARPPLMRIALVRTAAQRHQLVWTNHHLLLDGWSVGQLLGEVLREYAGERLGTDAGRYRDYIDWLGGRDEAASSAYWQARTARLPEPTRLGGAGTRRDEADLGAAHGEYTFTLDAAALAALAAYARRERVTVNTLVQGAWALLLARHTGQGTVAFGATVAGRPADLPGAQSILGLFINTLPVIVEVNDWQPVGAWLRELQGEGLRAREHEHTPLYEIQRWADAAGQALFDSLLVFENYPVDAVLKQSAPAGLRFAGMRAHEETNYALTLALSVGEGMTVRCGYVRDRFAPGMVEAIAGHLREVLKGLAASSTQPLGRVALLNPAQEYALQARSQAPAPCHAAARLDEDAPPAPAPAPALTPVHARIAAQALRRPDAVAVKDGQRALTYAELDAWSNRLARRLVRLGVGPEVRVGVALERSVELVVGMLAVLKAGGAYVPLDPDYPADRLAYMIADSGMALLLTESTVRERLPVAAGAAAAASNEDGARAAGGTPMRVVEIDTLDLVDESAAVLDVALLPENLAYVIYTSGSTGRPKGAQLTHGNVARLLDATDAWFGFDEADVWTMFHSYAFDFSVWELFGALCFGGRLVLVPFLLSRSPEEFLDLLRREQVTVLNQTPSAFRQLMQVPGVYDGGLALRTVIFGGEALEPRTLAPWFDRYGDQSPRLVNMYGITETTVHVTYRPITKEDASDSASAGHTSAGHASAEHASAGHASAGHASVRHVVAGRSPLGRQIPDLGLYVLDAAGNLAPIGVAGELHVAGAGLARGYLGRPGLTAERFIPNPFAAEGSRLYRTGDLARWNEDGELEYLGRIDHQVKIRGFRIELGEIEAQLLAQPGVREALVLADEGPGGARLVAYVTPHASANDATNASNADSHVGANKATEAGNTNVLPRGTALDGQSLRTRLGVTLPDYMVPSVVMVLDRLPLTANGKTDRKALPKPEFSARAYEAPQGPAETVLAEVWQDMLGIGQVGRHDNFFELGGDSILSLQIVAKTRQAGWIVSPRQLFEQQTVASLAAVAEPAAVAHASAELGRPRGEVALLPIQAWFFEQAMPNRHHWNQSVLLKTRIALDVDALEAALHAVTDHHDALRLRYVEDGNGNWRQHYVEPVDGVRPGLLWVRSAADADAMEALCDAAQRSLDITQGPVLRALAIEAADGSWRLLLAIHHLVVDGVSWRILLEDLQRAYEQALAGAQVALPPRTTSYQTWADHLVRHAASGQARAELAFWRATGAEAGDLPSAAAVPAGSSEENDPAGAGSLAHRHGIDGTEGTVHADAKRHGTVTVRLDPQLTRQLLQVAPAAYRTQVNDLLLTALGRALCRGTGRDRIRIDLEGHGREDLFENVDLSRTVGWFTSLYPVVLDAGGPLDVAIARVKETLRAVPGRGVGYGALRYLGADDARAALGAIPPADVIFNYLGQFDTGFGPQALWEMADESVGAAQDEAAAADHACAIDGQVYRGELLLAIRYDADRCSATAARALVDRYRDELVALIEHCTSAAGNVTPSDFPLAPLSQARLDALRAALGVSAQALQDLYPLSPMQSGMLFHGLYAPAGSAYVNQLRVDVARLDIARFRAAWASAVARHAILRTGFVKEGEQPLQWVARSAQLPVEEIDWRDKAMQGQALDELAAAQLAAGFDLSRPPLMRLAAVRIADHRHHLVWTHHHLLMDGWSVAQLLGEVLREYGGERLPASGGRYRDYIAWLETKNARGRGESGATPNEGNYEEVHEEAREEAREEAGAAGNGRRGATAGEAYWRRQVARLPEPTRLYDAAESAGAAQAAGLHTRTLTLSADGTARLAEYARSQRVTMNTLVQGAWALLLARLSGQGTVAFGATTAGRPAQLAGVQSTLGLFINTLPVVVQVDGWQPLGDWLRGLQAESLRAREHEHTPLYEIQRWAGVAGQGLFDSLVVFENYPVDAALSQAAPAGLEFGRVHSREETSYAVTLAVDLGAALTLELHGRCGTTVLRTLAMALDRVLRDFVELPDPALGRIALAGAWGDASQAGSDRARKTKALAGRHRPLDKGDWLPVHRRVSLQAGRSPAARAVMAGEHVLDYATLDAWSNRLAHRLARHGVGPEMRVGVMLERSVEMIVALLAVLKAGAAYVPLDPDYPADRLAYMAQDSGMRLLLTETALHERLSLHAAPAGYSVVALDELDLSAAPATLPVVDVHPDNLAYIVYTSGSTGRPKGVAVAHGPLAAHSQAIGEIYRLQPQDRLLQFASISFDAAGEQWLLPLLAGAGLVLRDAEVWSPGRLAAEVERHAISVLYLPPSYIDALAQEIDRSGASLPVRACIVGGEAWSKPGLEAVQRALRPHTLFNAYGPAETVITPTVWQADATTSIDSNYVPVGVPVGPRVAYVLDNALNPLPAGVPGELYLGGTALARGYIDQPGLTAARFVPDPYSEDGGRLYRTGDLVHWNATGQLEYLGRLDHQLKIRGFRVELGEVEAQLRALAGVREAVAVATQGVGGMRLVAYVSAGQAMPALDGASLRTSLSRTLPDYMVPAVVVVLDRLPLNANGKVDRRALPAPEVTIQGREVPQGDSETAVARIWQAVLSVDRVGRDDNFFEAGGDSITALRLIHRIKQALDVEIAPRALFESPTPRGIAARIDAAAQRDRPAAPSLPELQAVDRTGRLPLSPMQLRLWLASKVAGPASSAYNVSFTVKLSGGLDIDTLRRAYGALIQRHEVLRTIYPEQGGDPSARILRDVPALQVIRLSDTPSGSADSKAGMADLDRADPDKTALDLARVFADRPFDVERGPLVRGLVVQVRANEAILVVALHHLVCDGWSTGILARELGDLYRGESGVGAGVAPAPRLQYADFAVWHGRLLSDPVFNEGERRFWHDYLQGVPPVLAFETDRPRPAKVSHAGAQVTLQLAGPLVERLKALSAQRNMSPFVPLLLGYQLLLHRLTGMRDLVVGTDVAGRLHPELDDLVGFFVNVLPIRSRLATDSGAGAKVDDLLAGTQRGLLDVLEHQALPLDRILEATGTPRDRRYNPLIQALFVLQNMPSHALDLGDVQAQPLDVAVTESKFDLAVFIETGPAEWTARWVYASALFDKATIKTWAQNWLSLLEQIMSRNEISIAPRAQGGSAKLAKLNSILAKPKAASAAAPGALAPVVPAAAGAPPPIRQGFLDSGKLPLVLEARRPGLDAGDWAGRHRADIETQLGEYGAILFRGFDIPTHPAFEQFAEAMSPGLHGSYGDLPKKEGGKRTYRSTPYPEREMILFHNESSHLMSWPRKQWFYCELPSIKGGATPIVDCRRMLRVLPADIVARLEEVGLEYVRTFNDRLDVSWQDFFKTDDRSVVEQRCRQTGTRIEWLDGDVLQMKTACPAVIQHPVTGSRSFFNQVQLHHPFFLDAQVRRDLIGLVGVQRLPRNVRYGDGVDIPDEVAAAIGKAYEACAVRFAWQRGDVLMVDNMLTAHARDPYEGPRKIVVAMGDMVSRSMLGSQVSA